MRILGKVPHPTLNITVFSNDGRFPVQFELSGQTQIYRFRQTEQLKTFAHITALIDDTFCEAVLQTFARMQKTQATVIATLPPPDSPNPLPHII